MKKTTTTLYLSTFMSILGFSQTGDDGWNQRSIIAYENEIEVARKSISFLPNFSVTAQSTFHAFINPDLPYNGGKINTDGQFDLNYIRIFKPKDHHSSNETTPDHENLDYSTWFEQITYFDGLGKPIQVTEVNFSPDGADLITPIRYDDLHRIQYDYLPYSIRQDGLNGPGGFRPDGINEQIEFNNYFFADEGNFAKKSIMFDGSPMNDVEKEFPPGQPWNTGNGKPIMINRSVNISSEVLRFSIGEDQSLKNEGYYSPGKLYKVTTIDENGNTKIDFIDFKGLNVATKSYDGNHWLTKYSIYNDLGLLKYMIPPEAVQFITVGETYEPSTPWIMNLCYFYDYDSRKRLVNKRLPGVQHEFFVYNKRDQLVLSQDGNLRIENKWLFNKYDVFNRKIISGIYLHESALTLEAMQALVDENPNFYEQYLNSSNESHGYSNLAFPVISEDSEIYSVNYSDNYDCLALDINSGDYEFQSSEIPFIYPESSLVNGKLTVSKVKVISHDDLPILHPWKLTVNYFDQNENLIQTISNHHFADGKIISSFTYNSSGEQILSAEHQYDGYDSIKILKNHRYDIARRLKSVTSKINDQNQIVMIKNTYNDRGGLKRKQVHSTDSTTFTQSVDYIHNIRGWLYEINDVDKPGNDLFCMKLGYTSGNFPQYNGNISSMRWKSSHYPDFSEYQFEYDGVNRFKTARYNDLDQYNEAIGSYDNNGNIMSLQRYGGIGAGSYGLIDSLTYNYTGNQLKSIDDQPGIIFQNNGYSDNGSYQINEYFYDLNGNMVKDLNKQIEDITYNHLNLPQRVEIIDANQNLIYYQYDASGNKLRKQTRINQAIVSTTDYMGNFVYENGNLKYILMDEGQIVPEGNGFRYQYFLKDHLGNIRVVFSEDGEILQDNSYYPFGMRIEDLTFENNYFPTNKYLYNCKEFQDEFGLNWYDYGARFYDGVIGRWQSHDMLSEKYSAWSPYSYTFNNPLRYIDPDGKEPTPKEAVSLVKHVNSYFSKDVKLIGGWKLDNKYNTRFTNGFTAGLYSRIKENGETEYAFVTRGSDLNFSEDYLKSTLFDWVDNIKQLFGGGEQYQVSVGHATKISNDTHGELTFVGQSLGGGLATANALATGRNAITFNAAGISDETMENLSLKYYAHVTAYIIKGEMVDYMQSILPGVNRAYGNRIFIDPDETYWPSFIPGSRNVNFFTRINNHFIEAFENKFYK